MDKREKIVGNLYILRTWCAVNPKYGMALSVEDCGKAVGWLDDAIEMLKAQEPVKPVMHYVPDGKRSSSAWQCGNCLIDIGYGVNYCYNCGRAVKWDSCRGVLLRVRPREAQEAQEG